jgi:hypothetical protein
LEVKPSMPAEPSSDELRRLSHANTLRFPDPLEASFRDDYFDRFLLTNRIAWVAGLVLLAVFGIVDVWAATTSRGTILALRFGVGAPLTILVIALSFTKSYRRLMQPLGACVVALIGGMVVVMALVYTPREPGYNLYVLGTILVIVFGYSAPRLRFWYATAAGWTVVAATFLVGFDHNAFDTEHTAITFAIVESFIVAANALGMLAAYYIEVEIRRSYVQRLRVHKEQDRSEALLLNILPAPVAQKLKEGGNVVQAFDDVTSFSQTSSGSPLSRRPCLRASSFRSSTRSSRASIGSLKKGAWRRSRRWAIPTWSWAGSPRPKPITRSAPPRWRCACAKNSAIWWRAKASRWTCA